VGVNDGLLPEFGQIIEAAHGHMNLISHPSDFQQHLGGLLLDDDASQATDHVLFLATQTLANWVIA
jgi:hypothetical protein